MARDATTEEIKKAYKNKMKEYHPDKYSGTGEVIKNLMHQETKSINEAYQVLKDEAKRREYDAGL